MGPYMMLPMILADAHDTGKSGMGGRGGLYSRRLITCAYGGAWMGPVIARAQLRFRPAGARAK